MKTTTIYTQRLVITTDDSGAQTIKRTHSADTATEYLFHELDKAAQDRAIRDAIEEETSAYYTSSWEYASHTGTDIAEIWDAYRALAYDQPVYYHDHYSSFYLSVSDYEKVTPEEHTGICWSMNICGAWNRYATAIPLLIEEAEEHESIADEITAPYYWPICNPSEETASVLTFCTAHVNHADRCRWKAEKLAEQAKDAVEVTIKDLIGGVEDYYSSPEFWREWLDDGESRFTRDGERII